MCFWTRGRSRGLSTTGERKGVESCEVDAFGALCWRGGGGGKGIQGAVAVGMEMMSCDAQDGM